MKLFDNLKLKHKIIVSFLAVIFSTLAVLSVSVDIFFRKATTELADQYTLQGIGQVINNIESHMENAENLIDMVSKDSNILEFISWNSYRRDAVGRATCANLRNVLTNAVENSTDIIGIAVVNSHDFYISNEMYYNSPSPILMDDWYQSCIANRELTISRPKDGRNFQYYYNSSTMDNIISIAKPIYLPNSTVPAGAMLVDIDTSFMQKTLADTSWGKTGFAYILGHDGDVIVSPVNNVVPRIKHTWFNENNSGFQKKINNQVYEFVYADLSMPQWTVVGVFSLESTLKPISDFRIYMGLISLAAALSATIVVSIFSRTIVNPILSLNSLMRKAADRKLDVRFNARYTDEIGELGRSFNIMVEEINNLIEIVKMEQLSKRKAELQVLQEQIKPHFLYNTFDTIHWIAKSYGATEIVDIVRALTTIMRVGLSGGRDCISIQNEFDHAISYLTIQKIRYGEKLSYKISLPSPDECRELTVQKLILQPLIENALYHGIKNRKSNGVLLVKAVVLADKVVFSVTDNGYGIPDERLEQIKQSFENRNHKHTGYGLFNVNERIRISYGQEYGVKIFSKVGYYTKVEVHHPIMPLEKEESERGTD